MENEKGVFLEIRMAGDLVYLYQCKTSGKYLLMGISTLLFNSLYFTVSLKQFPFKSSSVQCTVFPEMKWQNLPQAHVKGRTSPWKTQRSALNRLNRLRWTRIPNQTGCIHAFANSCQNLKRKKERKGEVRALVALDMISFNSVGLWPF